MDIVRNVSLKDKNWFKTGGFAEYCCQPSNEPQWQEALSFAQKNALPITLIGHGANILISDQGIKGLVIIPSDDQISFDSANCLVTASAGVSLEHVINASLEKGFLGLEEFSGIPGSIGGAVYINVHYFEHLLSHFLVSARVINKITGVITTVDHDWFAFGYNTTTLHDKKHYLIDATFKLKRARDDKAIAYAQGRRDETIRHRERRYPNQRTCGSFFRNFREHEELPLINGARIPFVAYYLDRVGVRGQLAVGGASVSHKHANMIVTSEGATSDDVIQLAQSMQQRVFDEFGVKIQPECQLLGFDQNPLKLIVPKLRHAEFSHDNPS